MENVKTGDIAYWCHQKGGDCNVSYGVVGDVIRGTVYIDYITQSERRLIDGTPIAEYVPDQRWKKLPKGWTYNTKLFSLTWAEMSGEEKKFYSESNIDNPEALKVGLEKGFLIRKKDAFTGQPEDVITKDGWRVEIKYPMWQYQPTGTTLRTVDVYATYAEAKQKVEENIAEFRRQAALSDKEWSIEQIKKTVNRYPDIYGLTPTKKAEILEMLTSLDYVEGVERRK